MQEPLDIQLKKFKKDKNVKWYKKEISQIKKNAMQHVAFSSGMLDTSLDSVSRMQIDKLKRKLEEYVKETYPDIDLSEI